MNQYLNAQDLNFCFSISKPKHNDDTLLESQISDTSPRGLSILKNSTERIEIHSYYFETSRVIFLEQNV